MFAIKPIPFAAFVASAAFFAFSATGAVVWDEAVNGDLSNNRMAPTAVTLAVGVNTIKGSLTGNFGDGKYYDYVTFQIPPGFALVKFTFETVTSSNSGAAIVGISEGVTFPSDANGTGIAQTLGWTSVTPSAVGSDILPSLAIPNHANYGNKGFTPPLRAGTYSLWMQDYNTPATYQYSLLLDPTTPPNIAIGKKSLKKNKVTINGTASGFDTTVTYRVGTKGAFKSARVQSSTWTIKTALKPGKNIVTVLATSTFGTSSKRVVIKVKD